MDADLLMNQPLSQFILISAMSRCLSQRQSSLIFSEKFKTKSIRAGERKGEQSHLVSEKQFENHFFPEIAPNSKYNTSSPLLLLLFDGCWLHETANLPRLTKVSQEMGTLNMYPPPPHSPPTLYDAKGRGGNGTLTLFTVVLKCNTVQCCKLYFSAEQHRTAIWNVLLWYRDIRY